MDLSLEVMECLAIAWLAALGGAVGSFLNVVVYRLPAGLSLVRPGSHCPKCNHPIRWHDNVPVLGWLWLRGRCRDCAAPISIRYPAVEALAAVLFVAVGLAGMADGFNPARVACHAALLTTLLAAGLIESDGAAPPLRLIAPALAVAILAPLAWPELYPDGLRRAGLAWASGPAELAIGLGLGAALGWLAALTGPAPRLAGVAAAAATGAMLGGPAAVTLIPLAAVAWMALRPLLRRATPPLRGPGLCGWLCLTATSWLLAPLVLRWLVH